MYKTGQDFHWQNALKCAELSLAEEIQGNIAPGRSTESQHCHWQND